MRPRSASNRMIPARTLYLDLLKKTLTDVLYDPADRQSRVEGRDWPSRGYTMIGLKRLDNLQYCVDQVLTDLVPGDLIETGVWRGGSTIFMRAMLQAYGVTSRRVWVADSFEGLPKPDEEKYPADRGDTMHQSRELAISLDDVIDNFKKFGLYDSQVRFLKGWFRDTLPAAPIDRLSVLRLDGDMYESTMDALTHLYPRLSVGGFVIVDDYGAIPGCRQAVEDYRNKMNIRDELTWVDWTGVYWRRSK